jgi:DNA-binding NarL/FixJ family response regulator
MLPLSTSDRPLRVLLVDDHPVFLEGLRFVLCRSPRPIEVVGAAADGLTACEMARERQPDVVLMDVQLPGISGLEATQAIRQEFPEMKIIITTGYDDIGTLRSAMAAGASGYLLKRSAPLELNRALEAVMENESFVDPSLAAASACLIDEPLAKVSAGPIPSRRETEVAKLLAIGFGNKEVAARLGLSVKTVETYRARLMTKLELTSRAELVQYALRQGWLRAPALSPTM